MDLKKLGRRSFLKATAITGTTAAISQMTAGIVPAAKAAAPSVPLVGVTKDGGETRIVKTSCRACIHDCAVLAHVRNGRIVKLEGNPESIMNQGALCAKCLAGIQAVYHPNRNKYPLIRVGQRGENKWKRISWKEATDIIAKKIVEVTDKYGAESILCTTGGGGNPCFAGIRRLANAIGTPNFMEPGCAQCYLPRVVTFNLQYGGPATSIADENALEIYNPNTEMKSIVLWGANASYSCPAGGGRALVELRAKGVKTVTIDPRFIPDAAKADVWLPIRPGTDVAMMLTWMNYLIEHDLYDHDFCMKWTNFPHLVDPDTGMCLRAKDFFGEGGQYDRVVWDKKTNSPKLLPYPWDDNLDPALDGAYEWKGKTYKTGFQLLKERCAEWTLERCAKLCWVDKDKLEEGIKIFCEGPSGLVLGVATDQIENSAQAAQAAVVLNAMMGYVEKPGTLMQRNSGGDMLNQGRYPVNPSPRLLPMGQLKKRLGGTEHKGLYLWDAAQPAAVLEAMQNGNPYPIKLWLERSGNKLTALPEPRKWAEASKNVDFIVHLFMYPTSFSRYADMLLPSTEWLETNTLVNHLNQVYARQAVTHTWETVDETLVWSRVMIRAAELGHKNAQRACDPKFMQEDLAYWHTMEEMLDQRCATAGLTWKEMLERDNPHTFMPYDQWNQYYVYLQKDKDGLPRGFRTSSKRIDAYGDCYITLSKTGKPYARDPDVQPSKVPYDPLPYYIEPFENPMNEIGKEFPLVMTNGRIPMYQHGTLRNSPFMRELYPVPEVWVNPVDAAKYGVKHGDWAWIESKRGKVRGVVRATEGIPVGVVYMERFWTPETLNSADEGWKSVNVQVLAKADPPYNDMFGTHTLRGFQVKIYKADGAPEGVWTKPEQFKPWLPQPSDPTPVPEY
ncbi:molybdopterin-dependent oxidoreductase [Sutterella sp.]|uniref:molybdopterin-containing oxidoreductase family protein n=1 Tax=Sutterella sp. TaxID=1981025 RepID=UPI0026E01918|nr:molybdopterin-dependent oxidoreductase [Sutterella sp.]MDO5531668.1 molybdopterin-dependent oxidoreductase [Sutterella sp.]